MDRNSRIGFGSGSGEIEFVDQDSPDRQLARREPLHPDDEDFDHELDPDQGEDVNLDGIRGIPRDAIQRLLLFLLPQNKNTSPKKYWRIAQLRLASLAHLANVDDIGAKSLQELGDELGVTRSLLSLYQIRIINSLGISETRNGKSKVARESYRKSATEAHRRQGHRLKSEAAQSV